MCAPEGWKTRKTGRAILHWIGGMRCKTHMKGFHFELLKPQALETRGSAAHNTEVWCQFKCAEHQENAPN